jgi:polar amino acid transport system substrate-binding protein
VQIPAVFRSALARTVLAAALAGAAFAAAPALATSSGSVDKAAAALVPAKIKAKGTLVIAEDATYAPDEFIGPDGHTVVGMDADLAKALLPLLGLKADVVNATFDTIIPGLQSGKFDVGMSSFTDEKSREKQVNFVDYFTAGESFFEKSSGGPKVTTLASICGLTVSVEAGTTEKDDAEAQKAKCTKAGKKPDNPQVFPTQTGANLALSSGRVQVSMADSQVAGYQVKQSHGLFKLVGTSYGFAPYGIAVPKQDGTLDRAILKALKDLQANGTYLKILTKWGIQAGAYKNPVINGATS